jgi:hypothetical protein
MGSVSLEFWMLSEREVELAIQVLRRRLDSAIEEDAPRAIIEALAQTLEDFEAGRMPHRYDSHSRPSSRQRG